MNQDIDKIVNDANYQITLREDSTNKSKITWMCPFYLRWKNMLRRCYDSSYQQKYPSYVGCYVCDEWLTFSNFKKWMETQDWEGKHLDKDFLVAGNKVYSPNTCVFIHNIVNTFTNQARKTDLPVGVHLNNGKIRAQVSNPLTKKREHLGYFKTEAAAHLAWKKRKNELAVNISESEYVTDPRIAKILKTMYL